MSLKVQIEEIKIADAAGDVGWDRHAARIVGARSLAFLVRRFHLRLSGESPARQHVVADQPQYPIIALDEVLDNGGRIFCLF